MTSATEAARANGQHARFADEALVHPGSNARAWLLRILTNTFITGYRRRQREPVRVSITGVEDGQHQGLGRPRRGPAVR